jgi:dual specificity tyrosine-phosphorylation-regulated kinase 1
MMDEGAGGGGADGDRDHHATQDVGYEPMVSSEPEAPIVALRDPSERPVYKLTTRLIDTYKNINKVYYEAKAKRLREQADVSRGGAHNEGYDDAHYDYILQGDEIFAERYILKHRIGKGSFGQVVCAYDKELQCEVAIKIIKSRKPFMLQAQTEIDLLSTLLDKDPNDEKNIVRLLHTFVYRNHQCLVFEMLSYNLYELLKNTKFKGVSLNLIRKFGKQILRALEFLSSKEVDIIHCDLKPENILLRHPRRSAIKIIDLGSSCLRSKKTYTYIQSRFYRSPEILLGISYDQKIDMWSLGCVLAEMHTGEPLFGGTDQADQICRIVDVLGMPPLELLARSPPQIRSQFFERVQAGQVPGSDCDPECVQYLPDRSACYMLRRSAKSIEAAASIHASRPKTLEGILGVSIGGPYGRRRGEPGHDEEMYMLFLDFLK